MIPTDFEVRKSLHTVGGITSLGGDIDMTAAGLVDLADSNNIFSTALTAEAATGSTKYRIFYWRYKGTESIAKDISIVKFKDTQDARTIVDFAFDPLPHNYILAPWFDATGSTFVDLADDASLDLTQFTVAAWFNTSVADYITEAAIANKGGFGSETAGENMNYGIWMDAAEKIQAGFETGAGVDNFIVSPLTYNDGNWHLAIVTYDGVTLKLYMDGNTTPVVTLATTSTPETNAKPFTIGKNSRASDRFFTGKIDQVRIWNRAIGTSEVTALWVAEQDLDSNGLVHENRFGSNNFTRIAQKLTNETTAPAGTPVWLPIENEVPSPPNVGNLKAGGLGAYRPIIVRYTILGNTPPLSIPDDLSIMRLYFGVATGQPGGGGGGGGNVKVTYTYESKFGSQGSGNGQFLDPHDIDFDSSGNIFVADRDRNDIQKLTSTGSYISKFGGPGSADGLFNVPYSIAIDASNNIYVADRDNNRIQKFNSSGTFLSKITTAGGKNLAGPEDLAFDPNTGDFYVTDTDNERIVKFNSAHTFLLEWGEKGSGNGEFDHPHSIDVDRDGNVYVSSGNQPYIQKFTSTGVFVKKWGTEGTGEGQTQMFLEHLDVDLGDRIHLINNNSRPIINVWDLDGRWLTQYGKTTEGSDNGQFSEPEHITCAANGKPHVVDSGNHRIQVFKLTETSDPGGGSEPPAVTNWKAGYNADWGEESKTKEMAQDMKDKGVQLVVSGGDNAYAGNMNGFYSAMKPIDDNQGSSIRLEVAIGNHDNSSSKLSSIKNHFGYSKTYYTFRWNNVAWMIWDNESESISAQLTFFDAEYKKAREDSTVDWIFTIVHHPLYTADSSHGADEGNLGSAFGKMMDKYEVDLVMSGDNHHHQRTFPTQWKSANNPRIMTTSQGPYNDFEGVIYIINGTGGHDSGGSLYDLDNEPAFNAYQDNSDNRNLIISASNGGKTVTCQFISPEGDVDHSWVMNRTI